MSSPDTLTQIEAAVEQRSARNGRSKPNWSQIPDLSGRYVTLRSLVQTDLPGLLEAFSDGLGAAFTTVVPDRKTIEGWFRNLEVERAAGRAWPFVVLDASGQISGTTRYMRMAPAHRRLEIGGTLYAGRVQRSGLNTEAKRLLLEHAFETLGANVVQLRTDWLNHRSRAAIERLGAKQDGVLRGHLVMADGRIRDSVVYSITATEWPGVKANLTHRLR
jgi:RimJ/RimL family protein N-acetyltransferase